MIIETDTKLMKTYTGDITITKNSRFQLFGIVNGDIEIRDKSICEIYGIVTGTIKILDDTNVRIDGTVTGAVYNDGGTLNIYGTIERFFDISGITNIHENAVIKNLLH
ncbi:hypothetical protein [Enterococcus casseliflavus]|nr:hypothetical protein [Enterococcus casseliflavus]